MDSMNSFTPSLFCYRRGTEAHSNAYFFICLEPLLHGFVHRLIGFINQDHYRHVADSGCYQHPVDKPGPERAEIQVK